jgi:hypothetical protein
MASKKDERPDEDPSGTTAADQHVTGGHFADLANTDPPDVGEPLVPARPDELSAVVAELAEGELDQAGRTKVLGRLISAMRERGLSAVFRPGTAVKWIADAVTDLAPHVPVRDLDTLRQHYPGLNDDALAERLIRNATRATAGVGAVGGGVAAVKWAVPPTLLAAPVLLAAETVAVVGIELKLIGELHEVYGQPIQGQTAQRAVSMLRSWAGKRGVNPLLPGVGVATVLGTAARTELRDMILKRLGRNLTTLGPMLTGAAVASYLNRRATRSLGDAVRRDLRIRRGITGQLGPGSAGPAQLGPGGGQPG